MADTENTENENTENENTENENTENEPGAASRVISRTRAGVRHTGIALGHRISTGHQSDEEIRRLLIARQVTAYEAVRTTARDRLDETRGEIDRMERRGVDRGLTTEEKGELRGLREERKRRERALRDLVGVPFVPAQPTPAHIRRARRGGSTKLVVGLLVLAAAGVSLVVVAPLLLFLGVPAAVVALWWMGGRPPILTPRAVPERLLMRPELSADGSDGQGADGSPEGQELAPVPIRDVTTPAEAEEALRRAIVHGGGDVETVTGGVREPWGWSACAVFASGSPDDLNEPRAYRDMITLLKLRRNGLLIETDPDHGDTCIVRMVMRDPFTPELVGPTPYRAPNSALITDTFNFGVAMDAAPLEFSLAGLMLLMVADSGGGKSGIMLAAAEAVTSTRDAVVFNLDPAGTGVGDLGPAITLDACMDNDKIIAVLSFLLEWCSARARQRAASGWGNKWRTSPEHPAVCVFVDEWPQLSDRAKKLLIRLLLLGRKEAIWVYGGSQFGTKDYLGEAIGPKLSAKLVGACRRVDVTELLGGGALAEGYRADLIRAATHTETNDAGQIYAVGLPGMPDRPVRYQVREVTAQEAARLGAERAAAGLPDLTHTLTEAGLLKAWQKLRSSCSTATAPNPRPEAPEILLLLREAFANEGDPQYLTMDQIHGHLRKHDADRWGKWDDRDDRGRLRELGKKLSRTLRDSGIELSSERINELDGQPRGYYREAVEAALTPPD